MAIEFPYEEICQWRDICEAISAQPYNFSWMAENEFSLCALTEAAMARRQALWNAWKIQFVRRRPDPHTWFMQSPRHRDLKDKGWWLLPDWEFKIHFLEQVYILNQLPETVPQPWKEAILNWLKQQKCPIGLDCSLMMQSIGLDTYKCPNFRANCKR